MGNYQLSVIIPLYNQGDSIGALLDSLTKQSVALDIIVVNDMSDDSGPQLVEEKSKDCGKHRIRCLHNSEKKYAMHSRLHGLSFAESEYVMFADGDDLVLGTHNLEHALDEVKRKSFDIGHFRTLGRNKFGEEIFQDAPNTSPFSRELHGLEIFRHYFDRDYIAANLWGKLYRTEFLKGIAEKVKNIPIKRFDDKCLVTVAMLFAESYVGSTVEIYYYTPNNYWPKEKYAARVQDLYTISNAVLAFMHEKNCPQELQEKCLHYFRKRITVNMGQLASLLMGEIKENPLSVYGLIQGLEPYIDKEILLQGLLLANTENVAKIVNSFLKIKELPHV